MGATLWSTKEETDSNGSSDESTSAHKQLSQLCRFNGAISEEKEADINHISFMPGQTDKVMVLSENKLLLNDVSAAAEGAAKVLSSGRKALKSFCPEEIRCQIHSI